MIKLVGVFGIIFTYYSSSCILFLQAIMITNAMPCDSCGNECASACGTKHFRTCCFNYLRKRTDPNAMKIFTNKRLIDFILLQGRALFTEDKLSRAEENQRRLKTAHKNGTIIDVDLQTYYG